MSFRLAQIFLRDAFSAGGNMAVSSLKLNVRDVGSRLEREAQAGVQRVASALTPKVKAAEAKRTAVALQLTLATFELRHVQMALDGSRPSPPRWSGLKRRAPMPTPM